MFTLRLNESPFKLTQFAIVILDNHNKNETFALMISFSMLGEHLLLYS